MRVIGQIIGWIILLGSGLLMFYYWFAAIIGWVGLFWGIVIAIFVSPGVVVFPFVFWIIEGIFPTTYFILWGVGIIGMILAVWSAKGYDS